MFALLEIAPIYKTLKRFADLQGPICYNDAQNKEMNLIVYRVFSLTWPASMQSYWNKRKRLHKKRVQLPKDWFGTPIWPP